MHAFAADDEIRAEAFAHVRRLAANRSHLSSEDIRAGFQFRGKRIPLINPQRGIFKPQSMRYLLSIRTVFPKQGNRVWYDDQREIHRQLYDGDEFVDYAFMGTNPDAADNRWLREAYLNAVPIIYFLGIAPGRYQAVLPVFVQDWDPKSLKVRVAFGVQESAIYQPPENAAERRYALRTIKQRLHQASFREAVLSAYGGRCAISNMPEEALLDAAHIVSDSDEKLGQPVISNGLALSKIHHAAFDAHLLGIDPDRRIYVAERLLAQHDGPVLESLKQLNGMRMRDPKRTGDLPDRERLARRFDTFLSFCD